MPFSVLIKPNCVYHLCLRNVEVVCSKKEYFISLQDLIPSTPISSSIFPSPLFYLSSSFPLLPLSPTLFPSLSCSLSPSLYLLFFLSPYIFIHPSLPHFQTVLWVLVVRLLSKFLIFFIGTIDRGEYLKVNVKFEKVRRYDFTCLRDNIIL